MRKNSKGFAQILVIALILVFAGGLVYFGAFRNKLNLISKVPTRTLAPYPSFTGKPTNPSTTNWKTYTNNDWKFSIKYPSTYEVFLGNDSGMSYVELRKLGDQMPGTDAFSHFKISIKNRTEQTVDEVVKADQDQMENLTETKQVDIAGTTGQSFYVSGYGHTQLIYVFNKNSNRVMSLYINTPSEDVQRQEQADVDQILSTFKFIN